MLPLDRSSFEMSLYVPDAVENGWKQRPYIEWYYDEGRDRYFLFVPSNLRERLSWAITTTDVAYVDDVAVHNGQTFELEDGDYKVSDSSEDDTNSYDLTIVTTSDNPSLFINTTGKSIKELQQALYKEDSRSGFAMFFDADGAMNYHGELDQIHGRGNDTWFAQKKSWHLRFHNKADLLGTGEDHSWNLISNCYDATMIRNTIAYDIARRLKVPYAINDALTEVYIDGEYQGEYLLAESVKIAENRVNIDKLEKRTYRSNPGLEGRTSAVITEKEGGRITKSYQADIEPPDHTGGYLLMYELEDRIENHTSYFISSRNIPVGVESPAYATEGEMEYISNLYSQAERALFSGDGINSQTGVAYEEYFDMNSYARKMLLEEFVMNYDAFRTSQYFYKPNDNVSTKFYAGPAWDYDTSFCRYGGDVTQTLFSVSESNGIWAGLYQHEDFRQSLKNIYQTELEDYANTELINDIRVLAEHNQASRITDRLRWGTADWDMPSEDDSVVTMEQMIAEYQRDIDQLCDAAERHTSYLNSVWNVGDEN